MPTVILARKASASTEIPPGTRLTSAEYLHRIGVPDLRPCTAPFDSGYDSSTVEGHLDQSGDLMEILRISMACWIIADENVTRRKVAAAAAHSVPTVAGDGLFRIAVAQGLMESWMDLCADFGMARVECADNLPDQPVHPSLTVKMAHARGLEVQFVLGGGARPLSPQELIDQGERWLNAGAVQLTAQTRDIEHAVSLFDVHGHFSPEHAESLIGALGLDAVTFAAPEPRTQFALLSHFGRAVHLCDVRLEDLLCVESFRRGLHSAAFNIVQLHPGPPSAGTVPDA